MCEKIDEGSYPSPLYDKEKYEDVRTSYSCNLNAYDPLIVEVDGRIAEPARHGQGRMASRSRANATRRASDFANMPTSSTSTSPIGPSTSRMAASGPGPR